MAITGTRKSSIEGFDDYEIDERGAIYNLNDVYPEWGIVHYKSTRVDRGGYASVRLNQNGKTYTKLVHRLLAQHFKTNPLNLPEVNHIDGNKRNNALSNLEWVSHQDNTIHAYQTGLNTAAKKILDLSTGNIYPSIRAAADAIGMNYNTCCKRLEKSLPDFRLRYLWQGGGKC